MKKIFMSLALISLALLGLKHSIEISRLQRAIQTQAQPADTAKTEQIPAKVDTFQKMTKEGKKRVFHKEFLKRKSKRMQPKEGRSYITDCSRSINFTTTDDSVDVQQSDGSFKSVHKRDVTDPIYNLQMAMESDRKARYTLQDGYVEETVLGHWQAHIMRNGRNITYQGENKEDCEAWLQQLKKPVEEKPDTVCMKYRRELGDTIIADEYLSGKRKFPNQAKPESIPAFVDTSTITAKPEMSK